MTDLPAGPELDRLVAEKVMGWKAESPIHYPVNEWFWSQSAVAFLREIDADYCERWSPSTNIAHAWEVVEHLRNNDVALEIGPEGSDPRSNWDVYRLGQIGEKLLASAPTAPLAICLAALKAVETKAYTNLTYFDFRKDVLG